MNCNVAVVWMHDYLDGDLPREDAQELKNHLHACPACLARFEQLEKTEAMMLGTLEHTVSIPDYDKSALTDRIMAQLPKPAKTKERRGVLRFIYKYPGLTAAALFVLVMLGSFTSIWEQDSKLIVSGEDLQQVVINGNTVTVPEGAHVKGNLVVENGTADVKGEVDGNVTVIDGSLNLASTGYIAGQSRTIDQALDWFWYKVTETFSGLAS
ncbi:MULTISPECIES: zf-HC2 domain-containing protein [unclassified Paenibacillus]|uniref:zf-HC2 domain-containing protein n=1 Tax=unclassified Paenibacillus TaxID=185978 RepID=UPI0010457900|nr:MULTISPECIES: zf-HC2 domain-containing protein [unclassified Paenibacillus]NIK70426.1 anti-sigma factor RsiW [Paenibacillus sp. BK720]TCM90943.1 anti-sigma factor RsiW [Paenibacillus sp. BK033]